MATERRDSSGALVFVPSDSELRTGRSMQNIVEKSEELDKKLAEVDEMTAKLAKLMAQYKGKGIE